MQRRRSAQLRGPLRRRVAAFGAVVIASVGLLTGCTPTPPLAIAATGDSIAVGFDACGLLSECPSVSYATGSDPSSTSLYRHLLGTSPQIAGHEYNDAEVGARASDLYSQMAFAVWEHADVVTVLIGANDACANTVAEMTPVDSFQSSVNSAMQLLFHNRPGARVVMSSIPDLFRVWDVAHNVPRARLIWQAAGLCPSMLANPASTSQSDMHRRGLVSQRVTQYNAALAYVCGDFSGCRWDGGAVARYPFSLAELSPYDYFHPSVLGHRALARMAWKTYNS